MSRRKTTPKRPRLYCLDEEDDEISPHCDFIDLNQTVNTSLRTNNQISSNNVTIETTKDDSLNPLDSPPSLTSSIDDDRVDASNSSISHIYQDDKGNTIIKLSSAKKKNDEEVNEQQKENVNNIQHQSSQTSPLSYIGSGSIAVTPTSQTRFADACEWPEPPAVITDENHTGGPVLNHIATSKNREDSSSRSVTLEGLAQSPLQSSSMNNEKIVSIGRPFNWETYLRLCPAETAPKEAFRLLNKKTENLFEVGMMLELRHNVNGQHKWSIATVIEIRGLRIKLRSHCLKEDFYTLIYTRKIRPCQFNPTRETGLSTRGKCLMGRHKFPADKANPYTVRSHFGSKKKYAHINIFPHCPKKAPVNLFKPGMKLEAIDTENPKLIRPATVLYVNDDDFIGIRFDGLDCSRDLEIRYDSRDIFPVNWCAETGHPIEAPPNWNDCINNDRPIIHNINETTETHNISQNNIPETCDELAQTRTTAKNVTFSEVVHQNDLGIRINNFSYIGNQVMAHIEFKPSDSDSPATISIPVEFDVVEECVRIWLMYRSQELCNNNSSLVNLLPQSSSSIDPNGHIEHQSAVATPKHKKITLTTRGESVQSNLNTDSGEAIEQVGSNNSQALSDDVELRISKLNQRFTDSREENVISFMRKGNVESDFAKNHIIKVNESSSGSKNCRSISNLEELEGGPQVARSKPISSQGPNMLRHELRIVTDDDNNLYDNCYHLLTIDEKVNYLAYWNAYFKKRGCEITTGTKYLRPSLSNLERDGVTKLYEMVRIVKIYWSSRRKFAVCLIRQPDGYVLVNILTKHLLESKYYTAHIDTYFRSKDNNQLNMKFLYAKDPTLFIGTSFEKDMISYCKSKGLQFNDDGLPIGRTYTSHENEQENPL